MRWLALTLIVLLLFFGGIYAALPWLLSAVFADDLARLGGLDSLRFEMAHPRLEGVTIESFAAAAGVVEVNGRNIRLNYSLDSLAQRRLLSVQAGALDLSLQTKADGEPPDPVTSSSAEVPMVAELLPLVPADTVTIDALSVAVPASDFLAEGQLKLASGVLATRLTGRRPSAAEDLLIALTADVDGNLHAELSDADPDAPSTLTVDAVTQATDLQILARVNLTGYPLQLVQQVLGLPPGSGSVQAELNTTLPWPPLDMPDWRKLDGDGRFALDWLQPASAANPMKLTVDDLNGRIDLEQGRLTLILSGALQVQAAEISLQSTLDEGRYEFADGTLRSDSPGVRLRFTAADISGTLEPSRLEASLIDTPTLRLESTVSAMRAADNLSGVLTASARLAEPATSGDFSFSGNATAFPLKLSGSYRYGADTLNAELRLRSGPVLDLPLALTYQTSSNAGRVEVRHALQINKPLLAATLPGFEEAYDIDQGAIGVDGTVDWNADGFTAALLLEPSIRKAHYDDYLATDLSGQIKLNVTDDGWRLKSAELKVGELDVGFPVTNLRLSGSGDASRISVAAITADLLGGSAQTAPFDYQLSTGSAAILTTLTDLDLAALLALEGDDITGSGRLDGRVPLTLSDNAASVTGGAIAATGPGSIRLASALASSITQPGLDIALKALENFAYETLAATVNYDAGGNLDLGIRLEGRNLSVEAGRPIHYNLNISENIPVLLKSLRLQDAVTKSIEKKVRQ